MKHTVSVYQLTNGKILRVEIF